jgi:3-oxoacyl-[acyl-carrier protein] reductase
MPSNMKTALVTGASRGIGRATALALARQGFRVAAIARRMDLLDELARQSIDLPVRILPVQADITIRSEVDAAVRTIADRFGRIDVLVNNAGVEMVKPVENVSDEELDATVDTNLKGAFYFVRAVVPLMKAQHSGLIINISSTAGQRGFAEDAIYCASKFGIVGFSDALDDELRKFGICVCCISPGAVNTDLASATWSPPDDPYRPYYLQPEDVARVIQFVASQPEHVAIESIVLRPSIEPPYSPPLPLNYRQEAQ